MCVFFFQAEDGIRDAQESRGLGDVYKRQPTGMPVNKRWNRLPEAYRLPIRQLFAPSQVTIFIKDEIFNPFKRSVEKRLEVDLQREINYELSKMK